MNIVVKIIGLILAFFGFLMLKYFPGVSDHQARGFTLGGILIAIILILVGIGLIILG